MCGRFELNVTPAALEAEFGSLVPEAPWEALAPISRYNIAPSQPCLVLRYGKREGRNVAEMLLWGFRPQWANRSWINARDDKLFETAAFRESARRRRCLIPATGWYEWQAVPGERRKRPYYIRYDRPFAFAGVWTARRLGENDDWELTFAIVTTAARGAVAAVHDRMPLVLAPASYAAWLDPATEHPETLLRPVEAQPDELYPVSTYVNDPQNEGPECIARAASE